MKNEHDQNMLNVLDFLYIKYTHIEIHIGFVMPNGLIVRFVQLMNESIRYRRD